MLKARGDLSADGRYLWGLFLEIGSTRRTGFNGAEPLQYTEIAAWCSLTGVRLSAWEVKMLRTLDQRFLSASHD